MVVQILYTGVKNIHAYSWLAHARQYLESIAKEKKYLASHKASPLPHQGNQSFQIKKTGIQYFLK